MRPLEQPGLSPGQVPRHMGVGQWLAQMGSHVLGLAGPGLQLGFLGYLLSTTSP